MNKDLRVLLHELGELNKQAESGYIDRERWLDCIAYLEILNCQAIANMMRTSLLEYDQAAEILQPIRIEMPAMAEGSE